MPTPVRRRSSSPRLQPAAWMSTRLRTFSCPRAPTRAAGRRSRTGGRKAARPAPRVAVEDDDRGGREYADGSHTRPAARHACEAAPCPSSCPASSDDPAPARIRSCGPQPRRAPPASCRCGVLVGDHLFDAVTVRLHRLDLLGRHRQRLGKRRRVTCRRVLYGHREDRARLQVNPVLDLVSQVRSAVLQLRNLRVRILGRQPRLVRRLLALPGSVEPRQLRARRRRNP